MIEYRDMSKYWEAPFGKRRKSHGLTCASVMDIIHPFQKPLFVWTKVVRKKSSKTIELHLGKILLSNTGIGRRNVQQNDAYIPCSEKGQRAAGVTVRYGGGIVRVVTVRAG